MTDRGREIQGETGVERPQGETVTDRGREIQGETGVERHRERQ